MVTVHDLSSEKSTLEIMKDMKDQRVNIHARKLPVGPPPEKSTLERMKDMKDQRVNIHTRN